MTCRNYVRKLLLLSLFSLLTGVLFAQAPAISYPGPQIYTLNNPISALKPRNAGGAVPSLNYGQVTTIAGSGSPGSADGQGTAASFNEPRRLAIDKDGNIYVADFGNSLIRKITPGGLVSTVQTGGINFNGIDGITLDKDGNMFISDAGNNSIDQVSQFGDVTVIAGNGGYGAANGTGSMATFNYPIGIAADKSGNIYVADYQNQLIRRIDAYHNVITLAGSGKMGASNGIGEAASFSYPNGVGVDAAGNVYVADGASRLIRKVNPGGVVSTFAGAIESSGFVFGDPEQVVVDPLNNVYVTDGQKNQVFKITSTGIVSVVAGSGSQGSSDGIGALASFNGLVGIAIGADGSLYVADSINNLIRKITVFGYTIDKPLPAGLTFDPTTGIISGTPAVVSPATNYMITAYNAAGSSSTTIKITVGNAASVANPPNISYQTPQTYFLNVPIIPLPPKNTGGAVPANIYGSVSTFAGTSAKGNTNGSAQAATFGGPAGLAFDASGNLFVSEVLNNDIREITPAGVVTTFAGSGTAGLANGQGTAADFDAPNQIAFDQAGNMYVADELNQLIRKITNTGLVSGFAGAGNVGSTNGPVNTATFNNPEGIAVDPSGIIYVADEGNGMIRRIDLAGQVTTFAIFNGGAPPPTANSALYYLTTDPQGNLYFNDDNQVGRITPAGNITSIAGSAQPGFADGTGASAAFFKLVGITRTAGGIIYLADGFNNKIRSVGITGKATTVAGGTGGGYQNGVGSSAAFSDPYGLAVDQSGNYLYVADYGNNVIRKITITGYTIDKSLPNGLVFDPATGIISGTPSIVSPPETYTITAYNTGGSSTTTVNIQIIKNTSIVFNQLPPKTVCDQDFDPGATSTDPITYTSSDLSVATIVNGKIHIVGAGTTTITADDGTSPVPQTLTVTAAVTPTISITPAYPDTCAGKTVVFTAQITGGGANPSYQWQVNGQNVGANSATYSTSQLNDADEITCTLTSSDCAMPKTVISNIAVFTLDRLLPISASIIASETGPICKGTPVTFSAAAYTPDSSPGYQWQINGVNVGSNQSTFTTAALNDGDVVTCVVTTSFACVINPQATSNPITITLNPQSQCVISIPNTFTPNGDGINDLWDITALQAYPGCTVSIYSRDGMLVYNSVNYPKPWDGTRNGKNLPIGTYYYVIDLKNGKKPLAGPITIIR